MTKATYFARSTAGLVAAAAVAIGGEAARAQYATFTTSLSNWTAATSNSTLVATFSEGMWPLNTPLAGNWTLNGVTYSGHAGTPFPNIFVINPSPLSGPALTANGDENIDLELSPRRTALAFDVRVNPFGPVTFTAYNAAGIVIGSSTVPASTTGFIGCISRVPIARVNFRSVQGAVVDSLLDSVRLADGPCVADVDDGSGTGTPDGGVTIDDLLYYLFIFEEGRIEADVDDGSAAGTPDGGVTIDDLLYFLVRFESGC